MSRMKSSDPVYFYLKVMMAYPTDVLRLCVLPQGNAGMSKGDDGMRLLTLFGHECCPSVMMTCHARRHPTVCIDQGR